MAPTLFNLYFSAVVAHWCSQSSTPQVAFLYRIGRKLVVDRTAKSRLATAHVSESQFADDAALHTTRLSSTTEVISCASQWGLRARSSGLIQIRKTHPSTTLIR